MAPMTRPDSPGLGDDLNRLLTYAEFAAWAHVPERTARRWAAEKRLRVLQLGRHRRIRVADALAWLDQQYVETSA